MRVLIHHSEIALKGGNRTFFEKKLADNVAYALERDGVDVKGVSREQARIVCEVEGGEDAVRDSLSTVLGVHDYSFAERVERSEEALFSKAEEYIGAFAKEHGTVRFETKRADKSFPLDSMDIHKRYGAIANEHGLKVDYDGAPATLYTEVTNDACYLYDGKVSGPGGLPVGSGGRVLVLLSGGMDSAVAAYRIMRRGSRVDFLHVHALRSNEDVADSKIVRLKEALDRYQKPSKLFVAPYSEWQLGVEGALPQELDLVAFRRFLFLLAQKVCEDLGYEAFVTGDALAQVASQTLQNLATASRGLRVPVLRPLLSFDKQRIVDEARRIGVFDAAVEDYRDCCSIVSRKPATHVSPERLGKALEGIDLESLVARVASQTERV